MKLGDQYLYKGNLYQILATGKMKHPENGDWVECVIYQGHAGNIYVRVRDDFEAKFTLRL